jgi:mono/diheme cytochrome c family protein
MKTSSQRCLTLLLFVTSNALSAQATDAALLAQGKARFMSDCASCHGASATGDGPAAGALRTPPADLTVLARNNGGEYPAEYVKRVVDGRGFQTLAHGNVEMPVWGNQYGRSLLAYSEQRVQQRIQALVTYLRSIQRK